MNSLAIVVHVLSAVVWVGGMFFAWVCLRPVAAVQLEPALRLPLWIGVLGRFFAWVWAAVVLLPLSGVWMIVHDFGGMAGAPLYVHLMLAIGTLMILIFLHVFWASYRGLCRAVAQGDLKEGGRRLAQIRRLVGLNLILGILVVIVASGGRFL